MKNIYKLIALVLFAGFTACDGEDYTVGEIYDGQTALSFSTTAFNVSIPVEGLTVQIPVNSTTSSNVDRNFDVTVDADATTPGTASEYSIGSITIPAGEFQGTLDVDFTFANIGGADGEVKDLVLNIDAPDGAFSYKDSATITYFREIVCNDVVVTIVPDDYPGETSWEITSQADGSVVASGGAAGTTVNLPDGCYTFTIFDAFGDGICCAYGNGSYSVDCSIINHASGGSFGASESTDFCVNQ